MSSFRGTIEPKPIHSKSLNCKVLAAEASAVCTGEDTSLHCWRRQLAPLPNDSAQASRPMCPAVRREGSVVQCS